MREEHNVVRSARLGLVVLVIGTLSCGDAALTAPVADYDDAVRSGAALDHIGAGRGQAAANANPNAGPAGNANAAATQRGRSAASPESEATDAAPSDLSAVARYTSSRPGVERAAAFIGPDGGSVRLGDFEVVVPPGAVDRVMRFEIKVLPEQARDAHAWASFSPHNHAFAVPVILRVPLSTTESAGADDAHVLWWKGNEWEQLPTTTTDDGRLETATDHFSVYATQRRRGITMVGG